MNTNNTNISSQKTRDNQRAMLALLRAQHKPLATLLAPLITNALPGNLLPFEAIENDGMIVKIPEISFRPGDIIDLMWKGQLFESFQENVEQPIVYTFPISVLQGDGIFELQYIQRSTSGSISESEITLVTINTTAPNGSNIPKPLILPAEVASSGVTTEYLDANNNAVTVTIPGYANMVENESIIIEWDGVAAGISQLVTTDDILNKSISISLPGDMLRLLPDGTHSIRYYLSSVAGYDGPRSANVLMDVFIAPLPSNLASPIVPLADDGIVDLEDANSGVVVLVDTYTNAQGGDVIHASWGGQPLPTVELPPQPQFPFAISVNRAIVINAGSNPSLAVSYYVVRGTGRFTAPSTTVNVDVSVIGLPDPDPSTPENEYLVAATVKGGSGTYADNELGVGDKDLDATVTVPFYADATNPAIAGDVLTVHWGRPSDPKYKSYEHTVTQAEVDAASAIVVSIPKNDVANTPNNPLWPVNYTLSRAPSANEALSMLTEVNAHLAVPGGPNGLPQPTFPGDADANGWLLYADVSGGVEVHVAVYENMALGDVVTLNWVAYDKLSYEPSKAPIPDTAYTSPSVTVGAPEMANGITFMIPFDTYVSSIYDNAFYWGAGGVLYTVNQSGTDYSLASETLIDVDLADMPTH